MKNTFLPYQLTLLAREKGFDAIFLGYYDINTTGLLKSRSESVCLIANQEMMPKGSTPAPIYQDVIDWLREKHNIHIEISTSGDDEQYPKWTYWLVNTKKSNRIELAMKELSDIKILEYDTYYQALENAIEEALKLIK